MVLQRQLQSAALALRHVECRGVHHSVAGVLVGDALHDVGRRPVVGADEQRVLCPGLQVVEREAVAVFRRQLRITKRHRRRVARIAEAVELTAPGTAQAARIVQLQLLVVGQLVGEEE